MLNRKGLAALAACAALTCTSLVRASDPAPASSSLSLAPVYADAAPPPKPLMGLLDKAGVGKAMEDAGFNITGFVEASYTWKDTNPVSDYIAGRVFDVDDNELTLNQLDLTVQRTVDAGKAAKESKPDLGFTLETIYGGDARFIHANGMNFYGHASPQTSPEQQFDVVQAYADIALPIGNGLEIKAGKMVTHMGYESINPTANALYSHSYLFGYAIPFTHTGFMAYYTVNDNLTVMGGLSRGWNQALKDNNGDAIDFLGQVAYKLSPNTTATFNVTIGPEAAGDPGNWWGVGDFILSQKIGDNFSIAVNADYGLYPHGSVNSKSAQWYGIAGYAAYTINDYVTVNARCEWYDDTDGFTLAAGPNTYYEATLGLGIHPMPSNAIGKNLLIRPEIRYDYADRAFFDAGSDHKQYTAAVDMIFTF